MIKLRISYDDEKGLKKILDKLAPDVISWKRYKKKTGNHDKAEIIVKE
jgi:hypothetical protein